jgi:nitroreductase
MFERVVKMDFLSLAEKRYSVRKFADKPVEKEKLDEILEAGRLAPTACNNQPQKIIVANDKASLEKVSKCTRYGFGAPVVLIVCYDKGESWKRAFDGKDMGDVDAAIVTTHLMLEAADLGLGSTWVGSFDPDAARKEFALPENIVPVAFLPIGYPANDAVPSGNHASRKPITETVSNNSL